MLTLPRILLIAVTVCIAVTGCSSKPKRQDNACHIFAEKPSWKKHTRRAAKKWDADAGVLLAIMRQESGFDSDARPRRRRFLGIPLRRSSSAFGYAQAVDSTWQRYKKNAGGLFAQRDSFKHAADFIGWYLAQNRKQLKLTARDGYRNYLAYHEGWNGYKNRTYRKKKWLLGVAKKVSKQAKSYRSQMALCGF